MVRCEPSGQGLALTNRAARHGPGNETNDPCEQRALVRLDTHLIWKERLVSFLKVWCWRHIEGQGGKYVWGVLRILSVLIHTLESW